MLTPREVSPDRPTSPDFKFPQYSFKNKFRIKLTKLLSTLSLMVLRHIGLKVQFTFIIKKLTEDIKKQGRSTSSRSVIKWLH